MLPSLAKGTLQMLLRQYLEMGRLLMDCLGGLMVITCGKGERKKGVTVEEGSEGDSKFLALIMDKGARNQGIQATFRIQKPPQKQK